MEKEPAFILRASDPNAPALLRGLVDYRRRELATAERTEETEAALRQLTELDDLANDMSEWSAIYGGKQ